MKSASLAVARFCVCAWIGAAALFVVSSVREVRHPHFDSTDRDVLVAVRFPAYYTFGFALVGTGLTGTLAAYGHRQFGHVRTVISAILLGLAVVIMAVDYVSIYSPLLSMITPPGSSRPAEFERYHRLSEQINAVGLALCAVAGILLVWPHGRTAAPPL